MSRIKSFRRFENNWDHPNEEKEMKLLKKKKEKKISGSTKALRGRVDSP